MNSIINNLVVELHVPDFQVERDFYAKFGFTELLYDPVSGGGSELGYMVLERNDEMGRTLLNFYGNKPEVSQHKRFAEFPADTPRGYAVEVTIPVSDVETLWNSVHDILPESQISQPLIIKRWNKKDFRIVDPFGFYIRFTELVDWGQ